MKKIFIFIAIICFGLIAKAQYPSGIQTIGNDSNVVQPKGGFKARMIIWSYYDTTAANLERIRQYTGSNGSAIIFSTSDSSFYGRWSTYWFKMSGAGGGATGNFFSLLTNYVPVTPTHLGLGFSDPYNELSVYTNNLIRFTVPLAGISRTSSAAYKYMMIDTTGSVHYLAYGDGSSGSSGWSLTGNSGTTAGTNFLGTSDAVDLVLKTNATESVRVKSGGNVGIGDASPASLLTVGSGDLFQVNSSGDIVKIRNVTTSWPSSQGAANTLLLNDGSGNFSWTATLPSGAIPTLQQVITAGATLTGGNTIINGANQLEITNNTLAGTTGVKISSTSTANGGSSGKLLEVTQSGATSTANTTLYSVYGNNTHTGTNSQNYGVAGLASGAALVNAGIYGNATGTATNNYAGLFQSTGTGTNSYGVQASATSTATNNYGGDFSASGVGTTNIGGRFAATNASANYAIIVPTSSGFVGIGTSAPSDLFSVANNFIVNSSGTVGTGTWQATIIGKAYGGTGEDNSTGGTANTFWARPNGATGAATYRAIVAADLPSLSGTYLPLAEGTMVGNILATDNTYDIGANGATRFRTIYLGTSAVSPLFNATTGFQIGGAAASGKFLVGNGTNYVASTSTIPTSAGATALKWLRSDGTNYILSTSTLAEGGVTSGKILKSDGTNWTASTETYAAPGTSGNYMVSDGTNWTSATPPTAGANTALSNLASVSINTSLLAQTGVDLGSTTKPFRDAYLFGSGTYATTYLKLTGTPTSTRTVTFPDNTGTVGELNLAQTWTANQIYTTTVTTGTGATAGLQVTANSLTTGNGIDMSSSSVTTGAVVKISSTATVHNGASLLSISSAGVNGTASKTTTGLTINVANTGTTPVNNAINIVAGAVAMNGDAGTSGYFLKSNGAGALPSWAASGGGLTVGTTTIASGNAGGILFEDGSNKLADIGNFTYSTASAGNFSMQARTINMGDLAPSGNGSVFNMSDGGQTAYFDNTAHTMAVIVNGTSPAIISSGLEVNGDLGVSNLAGTGTRAVLVDATGLFSAPISDRKAKERINPIGSAIGTIMNLKPSTFYYKEKYQRFGAGQQVGFIAQDIQKVLPNSTYFNKDGTMGYNEIDLLPIAISAIQTLQKEVEDLQKEIIILKKKRP